MANKAKVIALYLPQYHPFKENDEWWGKGFTEWTSVGRAKPLFHGHYQPRVPADLGYYDLRLPEVREEQAKLAKEAGIDAFCYWHYWFGNGKQLMEGIFDEVLSSKAPDFPFCLGWANHSWYAKNWNTKDTKGKDRLLIEQTFPGDQDIKDHFMNVLKAFKDDRYVKVDNKPVFMVYIAKAIPANFISIWNEMAKEYGFDGIYFIGNLMSYDNEEDYFKMGYNSVIKQRVRAYFDIKFKNKMFWFYRSAIAHLFGWPMMKLSYKKAMNYFIKADEDLNERVIPSIIPNFDHSPRSGKYGLILHDSTPKLFYQHCKEVLNLVEKKENKLVFLRSWNEWGEGNYMEPDLKFGKGYIKSLRKAIDEQ